jgi:RNA polymerase sigma-70 factor (ECF subfamily)
LGRLWGWPWYCRPLPNNIGANPDRFKRLKRQKSIASFKGQSSLKTMVFTIDTHLAYDQQRKFKRWSAEAQDLAKALALSNRKVYDAINEVSYESGEGAYDMREHIDFCFTCISKTLPIEQQVALMLKDVYDFSVADIAIIIQTNHGVVKHLLVDARKKMTEVFDHRCALINKNGVCNQCSELNGVHNPKQHQQEALMKLDLVKQNKKFNRDELYALRVKLVQTIDPLRSNGADLQNIIMKCTRQAIGEKIQIM